MLWCVMQLPSFEGYFNYLLLWKYGVCIRMTFNQPEIQQFDKLVTKNSVITFMLKFMAWLYNEMSSDMNV